MTRGVDIQICWSSLWTTAERPRDEAGYDWVDGMAVGSRAAYSAYSG
jgi:hypothetical protein